MPRIFVPKQVKKRDPETRQIVSAFDFTDAMRFGQLKYILQDSDSDVFLGNNLEKIELAMEDVQPEDYLLPVGDPVTISLCAIVMARKTGAINVLKWDGRARQYFPNHTNV